MSKVICITGASSGIRLATAISFSKDGWIVYAGTRSLKRDREKYVECDNIHFVELDVTDETTIEQAMHTIQQRHGRLDMLFCNAGAGYVRALNQTPMKDIQKLFDMNVY